MSIVRWNLKEAGGKRLSLRTETVYKAVPKGEVAKQTEAQYCTEFGNVDAQRLHERKANKLTLGGLLMSWQRYERVPKRQRMSETNMAFGINRSQQRS